jgi:hypothetical protein
VNFPKVCARKSSNPHTSNCGAPAHWRAASNLV